MVFMTKGPALLKQSSFLGSHQKYNGGI